MQYWDLLNLKGTQWINWLFERINKYQMWNVYPVATLMNIIMNTFHKHQPWIHVSNFGLRTSSISYVWLEAWVELGNIKLVTLKDLITATTLKLFPNFDHRGRTTRTDKKREERRRRQRTRYYCLNCYRVKFGSSDYTDTLITLIKLLQQLYW